MTDSQHEPAARKSKATRLVELALAKAQFIRDRNGEVFAKVSSVGKGPCRTFRARSREFKEILSRLFFDIERAVPGASAVADAIDTACGFAGTKGASDPVDVAMRFRRQGGIVQLDFGDPKWRLIEIT